MLVSIAWFLLCMIAGFVVGNLATRFWLGLSGARTRDTIRRWWRSGMASPPATIKVRNRDGTTEDMRPVRASGLHLVVEPLVPGKQRTWRTISAADVVNVEQFWLVWKFYGGRSAGWIDEDGDEFKPDTT